MIHVNVYRIYPTYKTFISDGERDLDLATIDLEPYQTHPVETKEKANALSAELKKLFRDMSDNDNFRPSEEDDYMVLIQEDPAYQATIEWRRY